MNSVAHKSSLRQGFTIIEITIVLLIIGIIGGLLLMRQRGGGERAARLVVTKQLQQIQAALDSYEQDMDGYPEQLSDLWTPPSDQEKANKWSEYISKPKVPAGWKPYIYEKTEGSERPYELRAVRKDGKGTINAATME